jgi:hypothetical protein
MNIDIKIRISSQNVGDASGPRERNAREGGRGEKGGGGGRCSSKLCQKS